MLAHIFSLQHDNLSSWFHHQPCIQRVCWGCTHSGFCWATDRRTFLKVGLSGKKWTFPLLNQSTVTKPDSTSSIKLMKSCSSECFKMWLRWEVLSPALFFSIWSQQSPFFLQARVTPRLVKKFYCGENVPIIQSYWSWSIERDQTVNRTGIKATTQSKQLH